MQTSPLPDAPARQTAREELKTIALRQFASVGFAGTSLQQIADAAGYSKSSVLYHFASKEALLEATLTPAMDTLGEILDRFVARAPSRSSQDAFVVEFIDFLLANRLQVHMFVNQGQSLQGMAVIQRANGLIETLAQSLCGEMRTAEERVRFSVALGGAAYMLSAAEMWSTTPLSDDETRAALVTVVSELLAPMQLRPVAS
ncbi:TetR/AcrR family transcriptional regulator [Planctomonas deserti]|uniref:TetR/AcrR family transcriptional regulator n=1 Tax=Planctomonas deserti TaxID=2144185 RepID=UPI000D3CB126|nr:TetR/AcrR family transcriptional regulator [Planctomonas deserti]